MTGLVGRARELGALTDLVRRVRGGEGGTIGILGAAGMGKSRLLGEVEAFAEAAGVTVTRLGCAEADATVPLALTDKLASALGLAARDGLGEIDEYLNGRAAGTPQLVVCDDVQWIDAASLGCLLDLVRVANEAAVGFVFAARPPRAEATTLPRLLATAERRGAEVLILRPLDEAEVVDLVTGITDADVDDDKHAVLAAVAGNPFLAVEIAEAWRAGHTPSADSVLAHALTHLAATTRSMLESASVLGREAAVADVSHMQRRPVGELADSVREAVAAGLIDGGQERLRFRHDLIRDAVYEGLPVAVRGAMHRDAAAALAARDVPVAQLAFHLVQGALPGDIAAIEWLRQAAAAAAGSDLREAVHLLESARRLCRDGSAQALEVDHRLVVFYAWLGRSEEAVQLASRLLDDPRLTRDAEPRVRAGLAEALARGGDEASGAAEARRALALEGMTRQQRATLLVLAATGDWKSDPRACRETVAEARRLSDDDSVTFAALQLEGASYNSEMDLERYLESSQAGLAFARRRARTGGPLAAAHMTWALTNWTEALLVAEREQDCLEALAETEREARRAGLAAGMVPSLMAVRAEVHLHWCRWDDALAEVEAADEMRADQGRDDSTASGVPLRSASLRGRVAAHTGDPRAADHYARWAAGPQHPVEAARIAAWRSHLAFMSGDEGAMVADSGDVVDHLRRLERAGAGAERGIGWSVPWLLVHRSLAGAGRLDDAAFIGGRMLRVCERNRHLPRFATAARTLAAFCERRADLAADALEVARDIAAPLLRFHALCELAAVARAIGATEIVGRATATISELSDADGLRVPAPLLAPEAIPSTRRPRTPRPLTGWSSLTPTEVRIAELIAQGLSNRAVAEDLLVSRYTVETHVKHIFQKLGLRSRVQLATVVVEERRGRDI